MTSTAEVTHKSNLDKDTIDGFVEAIKARIIDKGLYDNETTTALNAATTTEALFTAVLPIYETFCRKKNRDKLLETFYGLIPPISRVAEVR